jgi:hypothetical protein
MPRLRAGVGTARPAAQAADAGRRGRDRQARRRRPRALSRGARTTRPCPPRGARTTRTAPAALPAARTRDGATREPIEMLVVMSYITFYIVYYTTLYRWSNGSREAIEMLAVCARAVDRRPRFTRRTRAGGARASSPNRKSNTPQTTPRLRWGGGGWDARWASGEVTYPQRGAVGHELLRRLPQLSCRGEGEEGERGGGREKEGEREKEGRGGEGERAGGG